MELSSEDALRINVLLASSMHAVRIDESSMTLHALSGKGEARVRLNPNCRDETYLRCVRETLSSHVLGSPGGYPIYLKRWSRMGQARDEILESLLLLGEPEAVVAVVNAAGITDEIARRAWWALQTAENARCMLRQEAVVEGEMGPVLADFLVEFLPFEESAVDQIASVRLVLQAGLISDATRLALWEKGKHKNTYYIGFLQSVPDNLPVDHAPGPAWAPHRDTLGQLAAAGNVFASQLSRLLDPAGQAFLGCLGSVLDKPANQDVMVELLRALAGYFEPVRIDAQRHENMDEIAAIAALAGSAGVEAYGAHATRMNELTGAVPELLDHIHAMIFLSLLDEPVVNPIFSRTDAIGTVMRRKLKPVIEPVQQQIAVLMNR
ncbi:MAG: sulfur reduction protein DsrS [Gammaproteobacteria bacterium]